MNTNKQKQQEEESSIFSIFAEKSGSYNFIDTCSPPKPDILAVDLQTNQEIFFEMTSLNSKHSSLKYSLEQELNGLDKLLASHIQGVSIEIGFKNHSNLSKNKLQNIRDCIAKFLNENYSKNKSIYDDFEQYSYLKSNLDKIEIKHCSFKGILINSIYSLTDWQDPYLAFNLLKEEFENKEGKFGSYLEHCDNKPINLLIYIMDGMVYLTNSINKEMYLENMKQVVSNSKFNKIFLFDTKEIYILKT